MYEFVFDRRKSRSNLEKHGIDFVQAEDLWEDPNLMEIPAKTSDEPRLMAIEVIEGKHWSAIVTPRDEKLRIISVRRSRTEEIELYES